MNTTTASTAPSETPIAAPPRHEHGWSVVSRHATSEGWLAYARCAECGAWRAERLGAVRASATPVSRVIAPGQAQ